MKALQHSIDITGRIEFTRRDLQLLNNLLSYNKKSLLSNTPNSYEGGVTTGDMSKFLDDLHTQVKSVMSRIDVLLDQSKMT